MICIIYLSFSNPIRPGGGGGRAESARADFNFQKLPWYLSNTYQIWPLLLKFIGEQDYGKILHQGYKLLPCLLSLCCSRTCQLFLNVNIVRLCNGSRKRVHGAISHYGPRSCAWLSTRLFSCFLIENKMTVSEEERWKRAFKAVTLKISLKYSRNLCASS